MKLVHSQDWVVYVESSPCLKRGTRYENSFFSILNQAHTLQQYIYICTYGVGHLTALYSLQATTKLRSKTKLCVCMCVCVVCVVCVRVCVCVFLNV